MARKSKENGKFQGKRFNQDDVYGIFIQEMEVDSDVNEDPNRERLLDESFDAFVDPVDRNN